MAKKRGGSSRKGSTADLTRLDGDDDVVSITSSSTWMTCCQENVNTDSDDFQQYLDDTFEKRASTRERALEGLINLLREDVRDVDCSKNEATIISRCLMGLRKGAATESILSARLLGLHLISLTSPSERLFHEIQPDLLRAAQDGKGPEAHVAAIETLAITCFVAAEDDECTQEVMDRLRQLWRKGDSPCRAASLTAWSLLLTSLNSMVGSEAVEETLTELAGLLHHPDTEVRRAAGEAVALLYNSCSNAGMDDANGEEDCGDEEEELPGGLEEVMGRMRELAVNRGDKLRRSRHERASLRSTFRSLLGVLEDGTVASVKIKLQKGDVLVVDTLQGVIMLNALRKYLAGGFQVHLQYNPLLHDIFRFQPSLERPERLTAIEKRMYRSPSSATAKMRTEERKNDRSHKTAARHATFGAYGDGF